jgi:GntR family transcriptional regulator
VPAEQRREPKYYLVKRHLLELIQELDPGSPVPTERKLSELVNTSRTTVRQALSELVTEGRLVRRQGSGTYVAEPKLAWPLQMSSFTEQVASSGLKVETTLISAERVAATEEIAGRLNIKVGASVHRIERLREVNGLPMALEQSHLAARRFPGLAKALRQSGSLYQVLADSWNVVAVRAVETIETGPASPREADLLDTDTGAPMLILSRHSFEADGEPVEWVISWYRGDRYTFVARLGEQSQLD